MTIETIITLDTDPRKFKEVPRTITIYKNSILTFRVNPSPGVPVWLPFISPFSIQVYFQTPIPGLERSMIARIPYSGFEKRETIQLGSGRVKEEGEYKYDIALFANGRRVFEEDPYIIII